MAMFYWQRFIDLLPSILLLAAISLIIFLYLRFLSKKIRSIETDNGNQQTGQNKPIKVFGSLLLCVILAPAVEELIFRAPLIICFPELTKSTWIAIILVAAVFGYVHINNYKNWKKFFENLKKEEKVEANADTERLAKFKTLLQIFAAFAFGIIIGYEGIEHQSLMLCFALHAGFNLFMLVGLPIVIVLVMSVWVIVSYIFHIFSKSPVDKEFRIQRIKDQVEELRQFEYEPVGEGLRPFCVIKFRENVRQYCKGTQIDLARIGVPWKEIDDLLRKMSIEEAQLVMSEIHEGIDKHLKGEYCSTQYWYQDVEKILEFAEAGQWEPETELGVTKEWLIGHAKEGYRLAAEKSLRELRFQPIDELSLPAQNARYIIEYAKKANITLEKLGTNKDELDRLADERTKQRALYLIEELTSKGEGEVFWWEFDDLMSSSQTEPEKCGISREKIVALRGYYGF